MKALFFRILRVLTLFVFILFVVFFWATSSTLDKKTYKKEFTNSAYNEMDTDSVFSIISYNIGYLSGMTNNRPVKKPFSFFEDNEKKAIEEFKKVNADIIAFQEIDYDSDRSYNVNQQKSISEKLQIPFIAQAINWDKRYVPFPYYPISTHFKKIVSGQSIFSKFSFKNHERIELERVKNNPFWKDAFYLERLLQVITVDINGTEVVIMNVHLEAFDSETRKRQTLFVMEKFKKYAANYPVILLGDFNSDPNYKNASILKILNLPNVGCAAYEKGNYSFTFDSKKPSERLDYIFYTEKSIQCISSEVLNFGEISDHLPVLMRFSLK